MIYVLPIPIVIFQLLSLAIGVAMESLIIRYNLGFSRRNSVEYAVLINLYSSIFVWLALFLGAALLPEPVKLQMISYVFFDRFYTTSAIANSTIEAVVLAILFAIVCAIEFKGFDLIKFLVEIELEPLQDDSPLALVKQLNKALIRRSSRGISSFFLVGALTNSIVLLVFLLRVLEQYAEFL